jgi:hypothetical protein
MTTLGEPQNLPKGRKLVAFLAAFFGVTAGLCTILTLVVTAAEGWEEHTRAGWPQATAQVQRCGLDVYTVQREYYWIDCRVRYMVGGEEIASQVHSLTTPAPRRLLWEYPPGQFERMQAWVDRHPEGTPMTVHYDPADPSKAALVETDMPRGGPQTRSDLKLMGIAALSCAVLLGIARTLRPRRSGAGDGV